MKIMQGDYTSGPYLEAYIKIRLKLHLSKIQVEVVRNTKTESTRSSLKPYLNVPQRSATLPANSSMGGK
ncbi:hypothetical protein HUJ05_003439 [Dendroctonus ponderosae]|nr:hypothetical protein HUJ05_003439 [Dendroctonus ponderosae]KAH1023845.1 hypothetical protein HUJ05_003439 [Dendroctonus ponderosae]